MNPIVFRADTIDQKLWSFEKVCFGNLKTNGDVPSVAMFFVNTSDHRADLWGMHFECLKSAVKRYSLMWGRVHCPIDSIVSGTPVEFQGPYKPYSWHRFFDEVGKMFSGLVWFGCDGSDPKNLKQFVEILNCCARICHHIIQETIDKLHTREEIGWIDRYIVAKLKLTPEKVALLREEIREILQRGDEV